MTGTPPPLLRYSPGSSSSQSLEFVFVGREHLVQAALDSASDLLTGHGAAHHLFIGERGMGKSHLVSMISARLAAKHAAHGLAIARLDEEPWAVRDYEGLLNAILQRIRPAALDSPVGSPPADVRGMESAISAVADSTPIVVIMENLPEIFHRIGFDGRTRLRSLLENIRRIVLVATAAERPQYVTRHAEPFFGFFDVSDLLPLDEPEIVEVVQRVARYSGHEDVAKFAGGAEGSAALHAAYGLLGGQPRVWTILGELTTIASLRSPAPLVRRVLDDLLPQYQDRVGALPPDQQAIVVLMVETGGALTVRQIAAGIGVDQRSASSQLRHLATKGWVRPAPQLIVPAGGDRRSAYYELREPLVRLCLQMKTGRGVPLEDALAYLLAAGGEPPVQPAATPSVLDGEPAAMITRAVQKFSAQRDRAELMALPIEWRRQAEKHIAAADLLA